MAKSTVVIAVQGADFSLANIYNGGVTSSNTSVADLMTAVTNGPNATCFIYNGSVNTSTTLSQNVKAYLIINVSKAADRHPTFKLMSKSELAKTPL